MNDHYDFLVIGGGSAGYAAARTACELGARTAVIDEAKTLGGLCILRGCMPSKTLIYSAEVLHLARAGQKFGLKIPQATADMQALHRRKLAVIGEFADYRQEQLTDGPFDLFRAKARFTGSKEIELDDGRRLSASKILLATGSKVSVPPVPGLSEVPFWTSDDILDLDFLPPSVIVLGGGVVACELAQFLRRIGSEVIMIQRSPHLLSELSPQAADVIARAFRDEQVHLFTDTRITDIQHTEADGFTVRFEHAGSSLEKTAPHLLNALGRRPATDDLQLETADVQLTESGHVRTGEFQCSSNPDVYAAGDLVAPHEIVHIAIMQGEVAARHALGATCEGVDYDTLTSVVFTDPQVATVGPPEKELLDRGIDFVSAEFPFDDHGKSILMEAKYGYVKTWVERDSRKLLAAECVGKDASELIHALAVALPLGPTVDQLLKAHWYHPTLAEIWTYPLEDCAEALDQS